MFKNIISRTFNIERQITRHFVRNILEHFQSERRWRRCNLAKNVWSTRVQERMQSSKIVWSGARVRILYISKTTAKCIHVCTCKHLLRYSRERALGSLTCLPAYHHGSNEDLWGHDIDRQVTTRYWIVRLQGGGKDEDTAAQGPEDQCPNELDVRSYRTDSWKKGPNY